MFEHMQKLPIRYFDTHAHGEIMSTYTNDVDTLREMISQKYTPSIFSSNNNDKYINFNDYNRHIFNIYCFR